jgi:hypothetical protein
MTQQPPQDEDRGFVVRGFVMLGLMAVLAMVVLLIVFQKPADKLPVDPAGIAAEASPKGWEVRYNAALALARRGSPATPWEIVAEILNENQQLRNFRVPVKDGKDAPDEASARRAILNALTAIREWRDKQKGPPPADAGSFELVRTKINELATHGVMEIKVQAEQTKLALAK